MLNLVKWKRTVVFTLFIAHVQSVQRFIEEPTDITVNYGQPVILPCVVADLKGVLQWTKDGFGLGSNRNLVGFDRYHLIGTDEAGNYSLYIRLALVVDDAEYQCQISGADGGPSLRSKKAKLTVLLGPKDDKVYIDQPSPIETTTGTPVRISCMAGLAKPAAKIKWFKNEEEIKEGVNSSTQSLENSSLRSVRSWIDIIPTNAYHNANISCQVSHLALDEPIIRYVLMVVKYPPNVMVKVDSVKVTENDDVSFECSATGNPPELTYSWLVNGVKVIGGDHGNNLILRKVNRNKNKAIITCSVSNIVGTGKAMHTLSVEYGPSFKSDPSDVDQDNGKKVTLKCNVDGNPPPEIFWTFQDSSIVIKIGSQYDVNVSPKTEGTYHCKTAVHGYPEISRSMKVWLRGIPRVLENQESFGLEGDTVQVNCKVHSVPSPTGISWYRHYVKIDPDLSRYNILEQNVSNGVTVSTLVISDAKLDDFGVYNCTAKNSYGSNTGLIILNKQQSLPLVTTLVAIIGTIVILVAIIVVIVLFKKKGKGYKDSTLEKHSMHSSASSGHDSVLKVDTRTATGSDLTPSDEDDEAYSTHDEWDLPSDHLQENVFRYSGDFVDPVFPPKDGANNNSAGYIPYVDYNKEYNPPPAPPPINYNRNSIYSAAPTLNNVDPRYSATYGNPYLRMQPNSRSNTGSSGAQPDVSLNNSPSNNRNSIYGQTNRNPNRDGSTNNHYITVPQSDTKFGTHGTHI